MFDVKYYKDYGHNYLILKDSGGLSNSLYQRRMITGNQIRGLLPCQERHINGELLLYYEITSRQSLAGLYQGKKIGMSQLRAFFVQLKEVNECLQNYLLEENGLILQPEYIFQNPQKEEFSFLYYPAETQGNNSFQELMNFFTSQVDNEDMKAVETVYKIADLMDREQFVLDEILGWFQEDWEEQRNIKKQDIWNEQNTAECQGNSQEQLQRQLQKQELEGYQETLEEREAAEESLKGQRIKWKKAHRAFPVMAAGGILAAIQIWIMKSYELSFYEKIYLAVAWFASIGLFLGAAAWYFYYKVVKVQAESSEENTLQKDYQYVEEYPNISRFTGSADTVFIPWADSCENKLYGMGKGNKYHIDLNGLPLTVGKMAGAVDMLINEQGISRMHARFSRQGNKIYITDLNSTNGTFKNGMRLEPNASEVIEPGDEIRLGKLKFIYR